MERILHQKLIDSYIEQTHFTDFFSFPVAQDVGLWRAKAGEDILQEGLTDVGHLYYMVSGKAKIFCGTPNGKTFLLEFAQGDCFFGELELLGTRSDSMGVRAVSECVLLSLPLEKYRDLLLQDATFLRVLCTSVAEKEHRRMQSLLETQTYPVAYRLAQFILFAAVGDVYKERNTDASAYLGISYRHYTQVIGEFVTAGYIEKIPGGYQIIDRFSLIEISKME